MFLVNSRLNLFTAAPSGSAREVRHLTGAPLIPKLRGNFAEFLNEVISITLVFSTCPPVSVLVRARCVLP